MAVLPPIRRFSQEDFSGETTIPSFAEKLFYSLNLFLNSVYAALNNGLTLTANTVGLVTSQSSLLTNSAGFTSTTINWPYPQNPPSGVVIMACTNSGAAAAYPAVAWSYANGVITVSMQFFKVSGGAFVTETSKTYSVTFWASAG